MRQLQKTVKAIIRSGDERGYVAECIEIAVVTQGATVDETIQNLREAVALHLDGEIASELGFCDRPNLLITMEIEPAYA